MKGTTIANPIVDEVDENKGGPEGGYADSGKHVIRIMELRAQWI